MKAEVINPFLEAAKLVLHQLIQISPSTGTLAIKSVKPIDEHIWIQIGMTGELSGNIMFGLHEKVAMRIVSAMMGGFVITEMDEMGRSAISELGNMISGNAGTLLSNQGVIVDITPPHLMHGNEFQGIMPEKALTIPLFMEGIGELDIQVLIS